MFTNPKQTLSVPVPRALLRWGFPLEGLADNYSPTGQCLSSSWVGALLPPVGLSLLLWTAVRWAEHRVLARPAGAASTPAQLTL